MKITMQDLQSAVDTLNRITSFHRIHVANVGNYHLDGAYGGWQLSQMDNASCASRDVLSSGHVPKRELYNLIWAYIKGIQAV